MNPIIKAAGLSWATAQIVKILVGLIRYGRKDRARTVWRVIWAGGMPSAHSALITSSVLTIFLTTGAKSPLFGLALVMACIVIYDRSKAFAVYQTFQNRYPTLKQAVQNDPILIELVGHRLNEVIVGVLVGLGCSLLVVWL